jgi:2-polyprenyl-3-methyl-5-hydroxy-6-metoxy-1,4-benzoquinol methylase
MTAGRLDSVNQSAGETQDAVEAPRYDFDPIDLESGSTHADVVLLVGENRRVLELGPATGYMSRAFKDRGCTVVGIELDADMARRAEPHLDRVIVGNLDDLDLEAELGDERFDAIVAADVLEHLVDPLAVLRRLEPFLADDGAFVLSIPNVAHGSVRLALLDGRFDYQDIGLLDRTHKTFFTRQSLEEMLDAAELGLAELHRHDLVLEASEVPFDAGAVPEELRRRLDEDPDARTYQFVVKAVPMGRPGLRELQARLREAAVARADAEAARAGLELALQHARAEAAELAGALAKITGREGELRRSLIEAHDQLLVVGQAREDAEAKLENERELRKGDQSWSAEQAAAIEDLLGQLNTARAQAATYRRTSPIGIAGRIKALLARARG